RLSTLLSAIIAICLLSTTGCKTDSSSQNLSEAQSVYDSELYLFRAVKKGEDKIGFEVCTIDKKNRRFIAQNQARATAADCIPAYRNHKGEEIAFTAKDIFMSFSKKELALAKMLVEQHLATEKSVRDASFPTVIASLTLASGSFAVAGMALVPPVAVPTLLLAAVFGTLGFGSMGAALTELMAEHDKINEIQAELSKEKWKVTLANMEKKLNGLRRGYSAASDSLAGLSYHWQAIMSVDPNQTAKVSSVAEVQQMLGWHLRRVVSSPTQSLFYWCHPGITGLQHGSPGTEINDLYAPPQCKNFSTFTYNNRLNKK
ncbi:MAG: hypothetical protein OXC40_00410, partial [Proteobacteria bacterium]|nr:hypothetical protein [Pseudomonadota bacterium]